MSVEGCKGLLGNPTAHVRMDPLRQSYVTTSGAKLTLVTVRGVDFISRSRHMRKELGESGTFKN